jgi:hypothetical protein
MDGEAANELSCSLTQRTPFESTIKNPFALNDLDMSIHADEAHSRPSNSWSCPGCLKPLTLKRSINDRPFFSHRSDPCRSGYETALHAFAKRIIAEEKRLMIPSYKVDGEITSTAAMLSFESASMETMDERAASVRMVPDCTLIKGDATLYVEVAVTHWVDERKALKALNAKTSMIEITLNRKSAGEMSYDELREYVLSGARRDWVHNAKHDMHVLRLRRRREAAADKATARVRELVKSYAPAKCPNELIRRYKFLLRKWRLEHLVGFDNPFPHWFTFTAVDWQTLYLGKVLFDLTDPRRSPNEGETIILNWYNFRFLADEETETSPAGDCVFAGLFLSQRQIPDWFNEVLITEVEKGRKDYGAGPNGLGNPTRAIKHYQEFLRRNGSVLRLTNKGRYEIEPDLLGQIWRCQRLENLLWRSIPSQNLDFKAKTKYDWLRRIPPGHNMLPEVIAKASGQEWQALERDLVATSNLVLSAQPSPVKNLLGLPLYKANELASGRSIDHLRRFS